MFHTLFIAYLGPFLLNSIPAEGSVSLHDFHVSKLDIRYNVSNKNWEISLHLFLDDLEAAIRTSGITLKSFDSDTDTPESRRQISHYLNRKIRIRVDDSPLNLVYIGKEAAESIDAVYIYLEGKSEYNSRSIEVENNLFHEIFTDQKNITSITWDKKLLHFIIMDRNKTRQTISL